MVQLAAKPDVAQIDREFCQHHWLIEIPTGPVSQGHCRRCGQVRAFKNFIEDFAKAEEKPRTCTPEPAVPAGVSESPDEDEG